MGTADDAPLADAALIGALRADLESAQWDLDTVEQLLGPVAAAAHAREQRVPALLALAGRTDPAATLTRLFLLGDRVTTLEAKRALPSLGVRGAEQLRLVSRTEEGVSARVDLRPHAANLAGTDHHWWVASDLSEAQTGMPLRPEHVLGIGSASLSLLRMTLRDPVGAALDLGCGCGIQALYLATHSRNVIATDLSARACAFTRFNALLNRHGNIEVRRGSLFDPVENETFDLITSNPPFVITPGRVRARALMEYRDGGMERDNLIGQIIRAAPGHLRTGGTLQMLANWEIPDGEDHWDSRVQGWLAAAAETSSPDGLRAWVVMRDRVDYTRYAELWMRDSGGSFTSRDAWEADYRDWAQGFTTAGVTEIGMGFLAMQRVPATWAAAVEAQAILEGEFPDGLAVRAALNNLTLPEGWADRALVTASDVTEERHYLPGEPDPTMIFLRQGGGRGQAIQVSTEVAALVGASDGEMTAAQIIGAFAVLTGAAAEQARERVAAELPRLLQAGMVHWK